MIVKINSIITIGIEAQFIEVEIDISQGLPGFSIVGLPDAAVRESVDRVRAAIRNSGFTFPRKKVTVNLSPASLKKEGAGFDLPIAVGILAASGIITGSISERDIFIGELSLTGQIKIVPGILPMVMRLSRQKARNQTLFLPQANLKEASIVSDVDIYSFMNLSEVVDHINRVSIKSQIREGMYLKHAIANKKPNKDFKDVKGQESVKRGLEIAAAGSHNVIMIGPPGSGKTMLAERMSTIMPDMIINEAIETSAIHSVSGNLDKDRPLIENRPFRAPHHTISDAALIGGGRFPRPGEVSLAHNGILFLDELPEFKKNVLEVLREPLEANKVHISRAQASLRFPARFILIAAMNPCPCGYYTDPKKECQCSQIQIQKYLSKISGPLLDRIDMHLSVAALESAKIVGGDTGESSLNIKERVIKARARQKKRGGAARVPWNGYLSSKDMKQCCNLEESALMLLRQAIDDLGFSARAYDKVLKIARTIADLDAKDMISDIHVAEAISYRSLDKNYAVGRFS